MYIELGGLAAGEQHVQLTVSGTATLDGTIDINLINGFTPSSGDSSKVMIYDSRAGTCGNIDGHGRTYTPSYNPKDLTLTIVVL